jgi:hypothetical protein
LTQADIGRPFHRIDSPDGSACYFFIIIVIRYETAAAASWALLLIVGTLFNDAITVAIWTGFHVSLPAGAFASLTRKPDGPSRSPSSGLFVAAELGETLTGFVVLSRMLTALFVLFGLLGLGFGVGYAVRKRKSRMQRRSYYHDD